MDQLTFLYIKKRMFPLCLLINFQLFDWFILVIFMLLSFEIVELVRRVILKLISVVVKKSVICHFYTYQIIRINKGLRFSASLFMLTVLRMFIESGSFYQGRYCYRFSILFLIFFLTCKWHTNNIFAENSGKFDTPFPKHNFTKCLRSNMSHFIHKIVHLGPNI